ncbi:hypothetical protein [Terribacillus saccharophilus]|uniref:hypothetical protein n=1 Tax=Terribacillus saccharophilus TaxID=361277 RepID=UPI000BA7D66F|nr:hypothetical protein [Terribacillus saccharophilus]PAF16982.1 hypothetical protein CHH51_14980 [Terribacillus saccharophilus]
MKAQEMLETIRHVEKVYHGITQMSKKRVKHFQREKSVMTVGVEYDSEFYLFIRKLKPVMGSNVYEPTAKKILNNWYLWATDSIKAPRRTEPFEYNTDPIEFLIKNDFRVDHKVFAKIANDNLQIVAEVKNKMPIDSILYRKLKNTADNAYPSPRGFKYEYLVKVVAGFSVRWN